MRRSVFLAVCFAALGTVLLSIAAAVAQQQGNYVGWDAGSPVAGQGTITGSGTWGAAAGWAPINNAVLYAVPTGGGALINAAGPIKMNPNTWGPAQIPNVPSGQYTVYAAITFKNTTTGNEQTVSSPTAILNVP